jgi:archaellin
MIFLKTKKSQAELITTVLLILISIAAVVLVSTFIINMVRSNLVGTDCFKTAGQIKINLEEGYTYYKTADQAVYISISRGEEDINLTGLLISIGDGQSSSSYKILKDLATSEPVGATLWDGTDLVLPGKSETRTYKIISTSVVSKVKVVPIIYPERTCKEGADEQTIPSKA